jgi:hypothetical protein
MTATKVHRGKRFERDVRGSRVVADQVLDGCTLRLSHARANNHLQRPVFRRIVLKNCRLDRTDVHGAIFEDCEVDGLLTSRMPFITGCAFRHVTLRGDLGQLFIRASEHPGIDPIDKANLGYYENVDWALDIREARAATLHIMDVPLHLIRRNPEAQAIVRRARLSYKEMKRLGLGPKATQVLASFLPDDPDQRLFVACARSTTYRDSLEAIEQLRKAGLAE